MIDWKKYFDKIFCIHFMPFRERVAKLNSELSRVGILNSGIFEPRYTFPSVHCMALYNLLKQNNLTTVPHNAAFNLMVTTYNIIKESMFMGYERILILEDDVAFLKNIDEIKDILDNIPSDFGICLFDKFKPYDMTDEEYKNQLKDNVNQYYFRFNRLFSTGCYSLSKSAILRLVNMYETDCENTDVYICKFDKTGPNDKIASIKNLCCQLTYEDASNILNGGIDNQDNIYKSQGLNYNDYNI